MIFRIAAGLLAVYIFLGGLLHFYISGGGLYGLFHLVIFIFFSIGFGVYAKTGKSWWD